MKLSRDLIALGLALTAIMPLSGCVTAFIPDGQVENNRGQALLFALAF